MLNGKTAFSGFSVSDIEKTRNFYSNKLQLKVTDGVMGLLELHVGSGNPVIIYPKENHQPASFTILNFPVDDIEAAVDKLNAQGIPMERYEGFEQDEKGIARGGGPFMAWFKDPSGNVLALMQE